MNRTNINTHYKKWLSTFLTGRHIYTVHNGTPSIKRQLPNRVLQGWVLSPTLLNLFMHDIQIPAHPATHILSYADDIAIYSPYAFATQLQDYIIIPEQWLHSNRMKVSPSNSTLTLIAPWANECNLKPTIILNNTCKHQIVFLTWFNFLSCFFLSLNLKLFFRFYLSVRFPKL